MNLYDHIMELANQAGYRTATDLCRAAGVPRATMSELKMGRHTSISTVNASKFCTVIGCDINELLMIDYDEDKALEFSNADRVMLLADRLTDDELIKVIAKASAILAKRKK